MDNKATYPEWMTEYFLKYAKKMIAKPIQIVDQINVNSIISVKQRLKEQISSKINDKPKKSYYETIKNELPKHLNKADKVREIINS